MSHFVTKQFKIAHLGETFVPKMLLMCFRSCDFCTSDLILPLKTKLEGRLLPNSYSMSAHGVILCTVR